VLAVEEAVVGGEDDQRLVQPPRLAQRVDDRATASSTASSDSIRLR
jgi:hypothetical protein